MTADPLALVNALIRAQVYRSERPDQEPDPGPEPESEPQPQAETAPDAEPRTNSGPGAETTGP